MGRRGGQKVTAAPNQTVESTTEVQTPDSVDESQLSESQGHDEVEPEIHQMLKVTDQS